jgi:hypothetical protein
MAAGVDDHIWTLTEIARLLDSLVLDPLQALPARPLAKGSGGYFRSKVPVATEVPKDSQ